MNVHVFTPTHSTERTNKYSGYSVIFKIILCCCVFVRLYTVFVTVKKLRLGYSVVSRLHYTIPIPISMNYNQIPFRRNGNELFFLIKNLWKILAIEMIVRTAKMIEHSLSYKIHKCYTFSNTERYNKMCIW